MRQPPSTAPIRVYRGWFETPGHLPWALALFAAAHFVAMLAGNESYLEPEMVATFWPGSGLLLGALAVSRYRWWLPIVGLSLAAQAASDVLVYDRALTTSLLFGSTNAFEALLGTLLLRWTIGPRFSLRRINEVAAFVVLAAMLAPLTAALAGAAIVVGGFGQPGYWPTWQLWALADGLGVLLIAPLIVLFSRAAIDRLRNLRGWKLVEALATLAFFPTVQLLFGAGPFAGGVAIAVVLPILVWAALRFHTLLAVVCTVLNAVLVIRTHDLGRGPFLLPETFSLSETVLMVQFVLSAQVITVLAVGAVLAARARSEAARRASDTKYKALFDSSTDGVVVTRGPRFIDCNDSILEALGYTREELIGKTPWDISPPEQPDGSDSRTRAEEIIAGAGSGEPVLFEWRHQRSDGSPIDFEIGLAVATGDGGDSEDERTVIAHLRDITERKRTEREIRDRLEFETLVAELSAKFVNLPPDEVDTMVSDGLRQVAEHLDFDRASIFERQGDRVGLARFWAREGVPPTPASAEGFPYLTRAMMKGEPLIVPDVEDLPDEAEVDKRSFVEMGQRAMVAIPVNVGGDTLAAVTFGSFRRAPSYPKALLQRLKLAAEVLANALARQRAERDLRESEKRFRAVFEASSVAITIRRLQDLELVAANPAVVALLGYSVEELMALPTEGILPGGAERNREMQEAVARGETCFFASIPVRHKQGHTLQIEGDLIPLWYRGEPHVLSLSRDVTEQRRAEEALRQSEEKFSKAFEASPDGLVITTLPEGRILDVNRGFLTATGFSLEEVLGKTTLELALWADPSDRERMLRQLAGPEEAARLRTGLKTKSGEVRIGQLSAVRFAVSGESRLLTVIRDITEQERAREALKSSEEKFFKAFHSGPGASAIISIEARSFLDVNDAWVRLLGWTREEAIGKTARELGIKMDPEANRKVLESASRLGAGPARDKVETEVVVRDGRRLTLEVSAVFIEVGGRPCLLTVSHDLTERKRAEEAREAAFAEIARLKDELERERDYLREEVRVARRFGEIVGESPVLREMLDRVEAVAATDATVLIRGESGVGKELVATAIHSRSTRADRPLVRVNCPSIPRELFESEFFGHVKGAFTGAHRHRVGRFQLAHGGTLFLDEIAEIPLELQPKLLRALQEGEIQRVGEERTTKVDVRVIAATNRDLENEMKQGRFREDLYYRISVFPLDVPPLSRRGEDVILLARHFIEEICGQLGRKPLALSRFQAEELRRYAWPGNIRELRNVIEKAVILSTGDRLALEIAPADRATATAEADSAEPNGSGFVTYGELQRIESENLIAALEAASWKVSGPGGAAELLGLKPTTLASKMKALGIKKPG